MKASMATSTSQRRDSLREIPIFHDLDDRALDDVVDCATEFEVERGHVLAQPNQPGEGLFVIEEGMVAVELPGKRVELGPGEFVGELALLDEGAVHVARVSAAERLKCLAISRDDFERLLHEQPNVAISMLRVLARRLATTARPGGRS